MSKQDYAKELSVKEIKTKAKEIARERFSDEEIEKIEITDMQKTGGSWEIAMIIFLKNKNKNKSKRTLFLQLDECDGSLERIGSSLTDF